MRELYKNIIKAGIVLTIFFAIFKSIGIENITKTILNFKPANVIILLAMMIPNLMLMPIFIKTVLNKTNRKIRYTKVLKYYLIGWSVGILTPAKIGELSWGYLLKKEDIPLKESIAIMMLDRLFFITLVISVSAAAFTIFFGIKYSLIAGLLIAIAAISLYTLLSKKLKRLIEKIIEKKYAFEFNEFTKLLKNYLRDRKIITMCASISIARYLLMSLIVYTTFIFLGTEVKFSLVILVSAITTVMSLIPITPNGIGTSEALGITLYKHAGINPATTTAVYLIGIVLYYGMGLIILSTLSKEIISKKKPKSVNDQ